VDKLLEFLTDVADNWKTTVAGVALIAATIAFLADRITWDRYMEAIGVLAGLGFIAARGNKKSNGNGSNQPPASPKAS
jgi:hypothetical protein